MKVLFASFILILSSILAGCGSMVIDPFNGQNERAANASAKNVIDATTWQQNYIASQGCSEGYEDAGSRINRNTRIRNDSRIKTGGRKPIIVVPERRYDVTDNVNRRLRCERIKE